MKTFIRFLQDSYLHEAEVTQGQGGSQTTGQARVTQSSVTSSGRVRSPREQQAWLQASQREAELAARKAARQPSGAAARPDLQFKRTVVPSLSNPRPQLPPAGSTTRAGALATSTPSTPSTSSVNVRDVRRAAADLKLRRAAAGTGPSGKPIVTPPSSSGILPAGSTTRAGGLATSTPSTPSTSSVNVRDVRRAAADLKLRRAAAGTGPSGKPIVTPPPRPGLLRRIGRFANPALVLGGAALDYKDRRDAGQSKARSAGGALASLAGGAAAARFGAMVPAPLPFKVAAGIGAGIVGADRASQAYDWAADKARPITQSISKGTGYSDFMQKNRLAQDIQRRGGAKPVSGGAPGVLSGGKVDYGTASKQAQSTMGTRTSRQIAGKSGVYGAQKGSAVSGLGGPSTINKQRSTITTKGKTARLASTQLIRDPKTGQQRVGDLAYKGGKAVYLARPSVASRDTNLFSRLQRWANIGDRRQKDITAAKAEYKTALRNTQQYQRQLGISPQSAKAQKLPGR